MRTCGRRYAAFFRQLTAYEGRVPLAAPPRSHAIRLETSTCFCSAISSSFHLPLGRHHLLWSLWCRHSNFECFARIGRLLYFAQHRPIPEYRITNRRVVQDQARAQEIENFHHVLTDISYCECTARVRAFIVDAYVRGAQKSGGTAEYTQFEGNTAVFTKRTFAI